MSDTTPDDQPVDPDTPLEDEPDTDTTEPDDDAADDRDLFPRDYVNKLRAENKRLREHRTAVETQRDIEAARNELRDQREVERIAAEILHDGTDVWRGVDIAALRDDDGLPDRDKIIAHANAVAQQHRHLRKPATPAASTVTTDTSPYDGTSGAQWSDVLRGGTG